MSNGNGNGSPLCDEGYVELWGECYSTLDTTELDLYASELTGEIPEEICELINLTFLDLGDNNLIGSIPECVGNQLIHLEELYLNENNFSTPIPPSICNILELIDVNGDAITDGLINDGNFFIDTNSWCYDDLPWFCTGVTEPTSPTCVP